MGNKHPDQIPPSEWRRSAETALDMYRKRWELVGRCDTCDLVMLADLRVIVHMKGQAFSPWNRKTRCRRVVFAGRCRGVIAFEFKAPGMTQHKRLAAPEPSGRGPQGHVWRAFEEERTRQGAGRK